MHESNLRSVPTLLFAEARCSPIWQRVFLAYRQRALYSAPPFFRIAAVIHESILQIDS
ncbi:hypothetical protein [Shewanella decolorationis]|uniref:hypothetical protein n=1 Tax=Shewanella decolorationis TaxID=256839 RepID=UPI001404FD5A|nr:hypothetical protein [Shewanella decolorationis]